MSSENFLSIDELSFSKITGDINPLACKTISSNLLEYQEYNPMDSTNFNYNEEVESQNQEHESDPNNEPNDDFNKEENLTDSDKNEKDTSKSTEDETDKEVYKYHSKNDIDNIIAKTINKCIKRIQYKINEQIKKEIKNKKLELKSLSTIQKRNILSSVNKKKIFFDMSIKKFFGINPENIFIINEIEQIKKIKEILNKTWKECFESYRNDLNDEINKLKNDFDDNYIEQCKAFIQNPFGLDFLGKIKSRKPKKKSGKAQKNSGILFLTECY